MYSCLLSFAFSCPVYGQQGTQDRSITSDDFAEKRPATARSSSRQRRAKYNFVRSEKRPARGPRASPGSGTKNTKPVEPVVSEIGVTMWRLRPPQENERGHLFEVVDGAKGRQMWLAERVGIETRFRPGEKIRFAIESSVEGYLYVFNRETFADGSLGVPYMIFPESIRDDNSVGPGILVDIPDQRDDVPYFNITPQGPNYAGELLTVVIASKPLTEIKLERDGKVTSREELNNIEFGAETEVFSRADIEDKIYSQAEVESACGGRARRTNTQKSVSPCGITSRKLTRDEPLPQSIFRARTTPGSPSVIFFKLAVL